MPQGKSSMDKESSNRLDFVNYLKNSPLHEPYYLTENNVLSFHWANWQESCMFQRNYLYDNAKSCERLFELNEHLDSLKETPIWLKNRDKTIHTNIYDLYQCYADPRMRSLWFDRSDQEVLISFGTEAGPYQALTSMRWMDKDVYTSFIHRKILTQNQQMRTFRMNSKIPAKCIIDNSPFKTFPITIHQITDHGLLFKIPSAKKIAFMDDSKSIHIELNFRPFIEVIDSNVEDTLKCFEKHNFDIFSEQKKSNDTHCFSLDQHVLDKYGNKETFRKSGHSEFYLFTKYRDLTNESSSHRLRKTFRSLVQKFEEEFGRDLKESA
jgi:hypothetical protein